MNKAVYYKIMFIMAGIWDIFAAIIFGILYFTLSSLDFFGITRSPDAYLWVSSFVVLVFVYGFMYVLVGLDIRKNHLAVSSGIISKFASSVVFLVFFILGKIAWPLFAISIGNVIFMSLFIEFYINYKKLDNSQIVQAYKILSKET
ncbi:MAG: hypothetical protein FK734_14115 [Asgard group archaeon]|nr:hypothetical protein [Asgard group archaeon]